MIRQERDRLSIALAFSVVAHIVFALAAGVFGGSPDLPDYLPPIRVELGVPETQPAEPEPPQPTPPPQPPEPQPVPEPQTPPEPAPEAATPSPTPATPRQAPGSSAPGASGGAAPPVGADPLAERPAREFSLEELMLGEESTAPRRRAPSDDVLETDPDSLAPDVTLPNWAGTVLSEAGVSAEQMSVSEATAVADEIRANPEFERLLSDAIAGLNRPGSRSGPTSGSTQPGTAPGTGPGSASSGSDDGAQGDPRLSWEGGERGEAGPLPELTPADFGGRVPAETRFVAIFQVDSRGGVVPGSIIFQQRSVYTQVNEKIRRAIASWRFDPAQGGGTESAVFTLVVRREDLL